MRLLQSASAGAKNVIIYLPFSDLGSHGTFAWLTIQYLPCVDIDLDASSTYIDSALHLTSKD